jgi:hypothetical protein
MVVFNIAPSAEGLSPSLMGFMQEPKLYSCPPWIYELLVNMLA